MTFRSIYSFLLVFVLFVGFVQPVNAQQVVSALKKPMPEFEVMPEEEFKKSSTLYKPVPFNDEYLAYTVRLPKNWSKQDNSAVANFTLSNKVLGEIDRYFGPVRIGERSYFSVQAVELGYQFTAEQWFILYALENGYTLEGVNVIDDRRVEVLYVSINRDITHIVYGVAQTSGNRVVFAQYVVPVEEWANERAIAKRVVESFKLQTIDDAPAEKLLPYQFLDVAEIKYPISWDIRTQPLRSLDEMSVKLFNVNKTNVSSKTRTLDGKMQVNLISDFIVEDVDEEIERYLTEVSVDNLSIHEEIEEYEDFIFDEKVELLQVKVYKAMDQSQTKNNFEFWLSILKTDDYYYFLSLLTPSRDSDYEKWARNTQTFRVVNKYISPIDY